MGKLWQRNYYKRIIRINLAYQLISNYIIKNPEKWKIKQLNKIKGNGLDLVVGRIEFRQQIIDLN